MPRVGEKYYHVNVQAINLKLATNTDGTPKLNNDGDPWFHKNVNPYSKPHGTREEALSIAKELYRVGCLIPKCQSVVGSVTEYVWARGEICGIESLVASKSAVLWQDLYDPMNAPAEDFGEFKIIMDKTKQKREENSHPSRPKRTPAKDQIKTSQPPTVISEPPSKGNESKPEPKPTKPKSGLSPSLI